MTNPLESTFSIAEKIDKLWKAATAISLIIAFTIINYNANPKILELILVVANLIFAIVYYVFLSEKNPPSLLF